MTSTDKDLSLTPLKGNSGKAIWEPTQTEIASLWRWIQHQSWQLLPRNRLHPSSCGLNVLGNGDMMSAQEWLDGRILTKHDMNSKQIIQILGNLHRSKHLVNQLLQLDYHIENPSIFYTSGRKMPLTNCVRMASFKMLLEIWNVIFQSFVQRLQQLFMEMLVIVTLSSQPQDWFIWLIGILYV